MFNFSLLTITIILCGVLISVQSSSKRTAHTHFHHAKNRNICPKKCRLLEATRGCPEVQNLRAMPNITEICKDYLVDNFKSTIECEATCSSCGTQIMLWKCTRKAIESKYALCKAEPETGSCKGYFLMYYYDLTSHDCKKFVYGGCHGNNNKFQTELGCYMRCGPLRFFSPQKSQIRHEEL